MSSRLDPIGRIFGSEGFIPRRICGLWPEWLVWEHVLGNALIWLAYMAVPLLIMALGYRRLQWSAFSRLSLAFAVFIVLCGLGHFLDMLAFFRPLYRLSGHVLVATGLASWWTVWTLGRAWPTIVAMKGPGDLERMVAERTEKLHLAMADLKLAEIERSRLATIVESSDDAIVSKNLDGVVTSWNLGAERIFGYSAAEMVGRPITCLFPPDRLDEEATILERLRHGEMVDHFESVRLSKDGRLIDVSITISPIKDRSGRIVGISKIARDISENRRAEDSLARSEARFRLLAESIPQLAWMAQPDGAISWYNRRWYDYTGTTPEQMEGWGWQAVHDPEVLPKVLDAWKRAIAVGETFDMTLPLRGADGHFRQFLTRVIPSLDADGRVLGWFGTNTDVDELKRAEEVLRHISEELEGRVEARTAELGAANTSLRQGERRYRSLVEAITAIVWRTAGSGDFESEQPGWGGYTGQSFDHYRGRGWLDAIHPDDRAETFRVWSAAYASKSLYQVEHRLCRHDGTYRHMLARAVPIYDEDGAVYEWVGVHADVEDQVQAQGALREAKEAAEAGARAKGEFLANMSHEIRTPMNGVIGMTDLLLDTRLDPRQRDYAETIRSSGEALLTVINDILDVSKIAAGKFTLTTEDFDFRALMEEVADLLAPGAHRKGLEIHCRIDPLIPGSLRGDPARIRQVLTNLAGNAVKFTEHGEVNLTARLVSDGDETTLRVEIRDTGIGIPEDHQADVFESFTQVEGGNTRSHGGTGLGLTICKHLVGLMGGTIGLESRPGTGSTFWFEWTPAIGAGHESVLAASLDGLRVLVVDDHETNRTILREALLSWGCRPEMATTGAEVLVLLHDTTADDPYGLVLIDHDMPGMDGVQTARAIKSAPQLARIPLVLFSSLSGTGTSEEPEIDLFVAKLSKPIRRLRLHEALRRAISVPGGVQPAATSTIVGAGPLPVPLRILLAEDNAVNRQVATGMVERLGCHVDAVSNGLEALEALDYDLYDLILMDVQMPVMDGYAATAAIRAKELGSVAHVPIIAMTANAMPGDREKCLAAGMDGYLAKPLRPGPLREAMLSVGAAAGRPAGEEASAPQAVPGRTFAPEVLLESCGEDPKFLGELLALVIANSSEGLGRLDVAVAAGDGVAVLREAHWLKGAFLAVGAEALAATCQELMTLGDRGDLAAATTTHACLDARWDQFRDEASRYLEMIEPII